jgi:hypothetical protein
MMGGMGRRPTTGPVVRGVPPSVPVTFRGRLCGRCLTVTWHPEYVVTHWCSTCQDRTPGQVVALPERAIDGHAADLLRAVHALATP